MKLRAAIRYSEFKSADKLPPRLRRMSCTNCQELDEQDFVKDGKKTTKGEMARNDNNCEGIGNPKYSMQLGDMEFYQCPLSIPDVDAWNVIRLITKMEDTGIPIVGHCLMDQTEAYFDFSEIINSERYDCHKELHAKKGNKVKEEGESTQASKSLGNDQQVNYSRAQLPPIRNPKTTRRDHSNSPRPKPKG